MSNFKNADDLTKFAICAVGIATGRYEQEQVNDDLLQEEAEKYAEDKFEAITEAQREEALVGFGYEDFSQVYFEQKFSNLAELDDYLLRLYFIEMWIQEYKDKGD